MDDLQPQGRPKTSKRLKPSTITPAQCEALLTALTPYNVRQEKDPRFLIELHKAVGSPPLPIEGIEVVKGYACQKEGCFYACGEYSTWSKHAHKDMGKETFVQQVYPGKQPYCQVQSPPQRTDTFDPTSIFLKSFQAKLHHYNPLVAPQPGLISHRQFLHYAKFDEWAFENNVHASDLGILRSRSVMPTSRSASDDPLVPLVKITQDYVQSVTHLFTESNHWIRRKIQNAS